MHKRDRNDDEMIVMSDLKMILKLIGIIEDFDFKDITYDLKIKRSI
jgi:hypothetical protein